MRLGCLTCAAGFVRWGGRFCVYGRLMIGTGRVFWASHSDRGVMRGQSVLGHPNAMCFSSGPGCLRYEADSEGTFCTQVIEMIVCVHSRVGGGLGFRDSGPAVVRASPAAGGDGGRPLSIYEHLHQMRGHSCNILPRATKACTRVPPVLGLSLRYVD